MRTTAKRAPIAALAVLPLALAGCSWFQGEEEDLDVAAYEGQLTDMRNESVRLTTELDAAEERIVLDCIEAQGFETHPEDPFRSMAGPEQETFLDDPPHELMFLPTVEDAERRGFWQWTQLDGAAEYEGGALYAEYEETKAAELTAIGLGGVAESMMAGDDRLEDFYYLPAEDQYAWWIAYGGGAWAAENHSEVAGEESELDSRDVVENVAPGGCMGEMVDAVYGGYRQQENEEEGWIDFVFRPEPPTGDHSALEGRYDERVTPAQPDMLECLDGRGREGWDFAGSDLAPYGYLQAAGEGENALRLPADADGTWPDPPDEVPDADDVEGWFAFERDLAVDFAECGDESGFRDAAEHAWEQAQLRFYLDIEEDTYAWQEEMRGYLEKAQEVIGG